MQRRIVAVLFTDLVRSTELFGRLRAERGDALRESHFAALREAVEASDGEMLKTLGDGVMAVFSLASAEHRGGERAHHGKGDVMPGHECASHRSSCLSG